jgi:hypothetical protein
MSWGLRGCVKSLIGIPERKTGTVGGFQSLMITHPAAQFYSSTVVPRTGLSWTSLPHLTHTLQPLDVVMFEPFLSAYTR